jgi:hypothetical protein
MCREPSAVNPRNVCGKPNHAESAHESDICLTCQLERELAEANQKLERMAVLESWLRHIQQSTLSSRWQTAGDFYRGKPVFLPQDLINAIDTALEHASQ